MVPGERATGAIRAPHDVRDCLLAPPPAAVALPASVDHRDKLPAIWDQGDIGACTSYALTALACYQRACQGLGYYEPSRMYTYYYERKRENTTGQDAGANIRDGLKSLANEGLCPLWAWPDGHTTLFLDPEATWAGMRYLPPASRLIDGLYLMPEDPQYPAHHHRIVPGAYRAVQLDVQSLKVALATGHCVVLGTEICESFYGTGPDGVIPIPDWGHERVVGGHAILACGYTSSDQIIIRNSWSGRWGARGYGLLDKSYFDPARGIPLWDGWTILKMTA